MKVTNDFNHGVYPTRIENAPKYKYIQVNPRNSINFIVLDADYNFLLVHGDGTDMVCPPNMVVADKRTGRAHLWYLLRTPVHANRDENGDIRPKDLKAYAYYQDVRDSLIHEWKSDAQYNGLMAKNPMSNEWLVIVNSTRPYELGDLLCELPSLPMDEVRASEAVAMSRNCTLFDVTRKYAYKIVSKAENKAAFMDKVTEYIEQLNTGLENPLGARELVAIVKSIVNWTWSRHFKEGNMAWRKEISEKGAKASGEKRHAVHVGRREAVMDLIRQGYSQTEASKALDIPKATVKRYVRENRREGLISPDQLSLFADDGSIALEGTDAERK